MTASPVPEGTTAEPVQDARAERASSQTAEARKEVEVSKEAGEVSQESGNTTASQPPIDSDRSPSATRAESEKSESNDSALEEGEVEDTAEYKEDNSTSPAPQQDEQSRPDAAPPLPNEPAPAPEDDGWEYHWNPNDASYWFYNRFTGVWQKENPRIPDAAAAAAAAAAVYTTQAYTTPIVAAAPGTTQRLPDQQNPPLPPLPPDADKTTIISHPESIAGGYNPAIHGSYDENAWYAKKARAEKEDAAAAASLIPGTIPGAEIPATGAYFNRWTGQWQMPELGQTPERHTDEAKSRRQMNAFFDVDAAANMHDGRSLKAERAGKKPSKAELKAFKEKRKAKKEEKRRAWLRD